jgi:hypothetical protein
MADSNTHNKTLHFTLLKKKPTYLRLDILSIPVIAFAYNYAFGDLALDGEHILASVCMILAVSSVALIFLLNFWSVSANVFLCYSTLKNDQIDKCTHVKVKLHNAK